MTDSPEIPADVMAAARAMDDDNFFDGRVKLIARAILAERQRCMDVARDVILAADSSVAPYIVAGASMVLAKIQGHQA